MSALLQAINAHLFAGQRPTPGSIGECAAIHMSDEVPELYEAHLYIWKQDFNDPATVAKWFEDEGATNVWVMHVLHNEANGTRSGVEVVDQARHWNVSFTLKGRSSPGTALIAAERWRQVGEEGWDSKHDDDHHDHSLALAACAYAAPEPIFTHGVGIRGDHVFRDAWPRSWNTDYDKRRRFHGALIRASEQGSAERVRCLVKAGALIAAEIDRLQRAAAKKAVANG